MCAIWLVGCSTRVAGAGRDGTFTLTGPAGQTTWGELLAACESMTAPARAEPVRTDDAFLRAGGVQPWIGLPLDAVLDPGVAAVADFEELDRGAAVGCVGREDLVTPPVDLVEQGELRAGVGAFPAADRPGAGRE